MSASVARTSMSVILGIASGKKSLSNKCGFKLKKNRGSFPGFFVFGHKHSLAISQNSVMLWYEKIHTIYFLSFASLCFLC